LQPGFHQRVSRKGDFAVGIGRFRQRDGEDIIQAFRRHVRPRTQELTIQTNYHSQDL